VKVHGSWFLRPFDTIPSPAGDLPPPGPSHLHLPPRVSILALSPFLAKQAQRPFVDLSRPGTLVSSSPCSTYRSCFWLPEVTRTFLIGAASITKPSSGVGSFFFVSVPELRGVAGIYEPKILLAVSPSQAYLRPIFFFFLAEPSSPSNHYKLPPRRPPFQWFQ